MNSNISKRISKLSPETRKLFEQLLKAEKVNTSRLFAIPRRTESGNIQLSFAQQRLWFIHQLEPQSAAYNLPTAVRLSGALNLRALRQTINEIIRRHETLRTSFVSIDGQPQQVIAAFTPRTLPLIDLSVLAAATRESEMQRLAVAEARQAFDLAAESLLRVQVVRLSAAEHVVLFTMHHIVSDGWSLGVLIGELTALYGAYASGEGSPLRELELQYADYAVWQREWLQGEVLAEQLGYWKEQLAGLPAELELGVGRARPAVQSYRGATVSFAVSAEVSARLKRLGQREGATLFMTLLAAFKVLLYRYTGEVDILVGSPIANRNRAELENLIGFFVNFQVLRSNLSGNPRFTELLRQVRATSLTAYEHQDIPFEKLVEELQPKRDLSRHPLFQVAFVLQNAPAEELKVSGLTLSPVNIETGTSMFDITLSMTEGTDGLSGSLKYSTDLFNETTIEHLVSHFVSLLASIAANPEQKLLELPLVSDARASRAEIPEVQQQSAREVTPKATAGPEILIFDADLLEEREYWIKKLSREIGRANLVLDYERPKDYCPERDVAELRLSGALYQKLNKLTGGSSFLLYTTLMAALKTTLYKYSGDNVIVIGSPVLTDVNRSKEKTNLLAIADDVDELMSFQQLLLRVRETLQEANKRHRYPYQRIVKDLGLENVENRCPLFDVVLVLENIHASIPDVRNDITITFVDNSKEVYGRIEFNRSLLRMETVERFGKHFTNVLREALEDTTAPVHKLNLLTETELHQLVVKFNDTAKDYLRDASITELFEAQVQMRPDAVAIISKDERLTYQELNCRANRLAQYLRTLGVETEALIGVFMEQSIEVVVAILGILKAGGVYVPFDPAYPQERLSFMLEDAAPSVLLTQRRLLTRLPVQHARVVCLDAEWEAIAQHSGENPLWKGTVENLAYVIYTSGSTGQPKGVMIEHQGVANLVAWQSANFNITNLSRISQCFSYSFDGAVGETFMALLNGATLVQLSLAELTPDELTKALNKYEITVAVFVPSVIKNLNPDLLNNLDHLTIVSVGEICPLDLALKWCEKCAFMNAYGPTEFTVYSHLYQVKSPDIADLDCVPIGPPIHNTKSFILDSYLKPVPVGVAGELYIGGDGLARGYLHRPELTAEKFIPHPFAGEGGARLYRTGDRARYQADGNIEYLGRLDEQVKVRGYRIELGEIEAALVGHPEIKEAVVVASEGGEKRLVAYVVSRREQRPEQRELREWLKQKLPDYMVPQMFVTLEALPLTANGKVDRRALPAATEQGWELSEGYVAPRTVLEELIANIWAGVLGVARVGIHDNFFELGGHSLLATQVISRVREAVQVELAVSTLFEEPTVAGQARRCEEGRRRPQQLAPPLQRQRRDSALPLSFAQQRLWFIDQLEPQSAAYNLPAAVRLSGALNLRALRQTINEIIRRHETLRTSFVSIDGQPQQVIAAYSPRALPLIDLSALAPATRESETQRLAAREARQAFDLAAESLLRVQVVRLSAAEHVVLFTMHHIVSDGWSLGVLISELTSLYGAYASGAGSPLRELELQYADYAVWQREWLQGEVLAEQLGYWKEQLGELPTELELGVGRARPAVQSYRGATVSFAVSAEVSAGLKRLSQREGATLFMTLLAAFKVLLQRYSGAAEIVVGTPIANRTQGETESLIGFFVNTLVLRTKIGGNPSFRELLGRVRETAIGAYAHQELPFEKLVEELQPTRDLTRHPLFQILFAMQNMPVSELELPGLMLKHVGIASETSKFDLSLFLSEAGPGLAGAVEYNTDLFDEQTIRRMIGHYETLLRAIVENPQQPLSALPLLSESEQYQLLEEWNETSAAYPRELCIHELFEAQVERTPAAIAVVFEEEEVSYAELNRRANQLAHYLRGLGVGAETLVGLALERSVEMVVGVLGVLKAGGGYVPLEASYPRERLRFMLEDTGLRVLVTQARLRERMPEHKAAVVCVDTEWEVIEGESGENLESEVTAENLAYVIYTSGSTGQPKGVQISHRNVVNFLSSMVQPLNLTEQDTLLSVTTLSFDIAVLELLLPLTVGSRVVVTPVEITSDAKELGQRLTDSHATVMQATPATWRLLVESGWQAQNQLRKLCGGESLSPELANRLTGKEDFIWNLYGPTETTIWSTMSRITINSESISIGRPIANTEIYILDAELNPTPVGVAGELYIGGDGLARGYLYRPELTAEKFIPHPFAGEGGARLYRTGDRARYQADGNIEYLGRLDEQVKVRGYRIELGEIEAALVGHPEIKGAVAVASEDGAGEKRLVAYVVTGTEPRPEQRELREWLKQKLPDYMVPQLFVTLEALPLTTNGKVDRRALPAAAEQRWEQRESYVAPRTVLEELIANIWAGVLGIERVGIHDNFFELGGHSLLAVRILSRMRDAFHVNLPVRSFFESPSVAVLAAYVEKGIREDEVQWDSRIPRVERNGALPLSFAQQRLWFIDQLEPQSAAYNIPAAVRLSGALNLRALRQTINEIIRRHETLRTSFVSVDGQPQQVIAAYSPRALPLIDLSALAAATRESEMQRLAEREARQAFDLAAESLLRVQVVRLSAAEHVVLFTMHHIVSDGWSLGVLISELTSLYGAYASGAASPLRELELQYADYAVWQREWLQGEVLAEQLGYWKQQLAELPTELELGVGRARPAVQSYRGATVSFAVSAEVSAGLKRLSQREGATLFMTLLAAFKVLLQRYSGAAEIVVGTPIANRTQGETESLIGFFVNTLVLRTKIGGNPSFRELLGRVRETAIGAYAHQELPFEKLVEELQPTRDLTRHPLFQILFVFHTPQRQLHASDLTLDPIKVDADTAKFDLTLFLVEEPDRLTGTLEYSTDIFEAETIERMSRHFQVLLEAIVDDAEQRLADLPLMTDGELEQALVKWNNTHAAYPADRCIHELFEAQVERTPEAIAVVFEEEEVSYAELNQRANQLAHYLRGLGVRAETLVGLALERSVEMVVGVLGVLKAGGGYVPLDASYPRERLQFMLEDAAVSVLVTQTRLMERMPEHEAAVVCVDTEWEVIERESGDNLENGVTPENLAYVIYTSGSTGRPKGVSLAQKPLVNLLAWHLSTMLVGARTLQFASLSFDASFHEIFATLFSGGTLFVISEALRPDMAGLSTYLRERAIEKVILPVTVLQKLAEIHAKQGQAFTDLKEITTTGEQLQITNPIIELFEKLETCSFHNHYGPSETHVVTSLTLGDSPKLWPVYPAIGRPIANTEIYILDAGLNPTPVGVTGELYIGGDGLARGYLHRPELTAEKFIPHPFAREGGARLYRTGDRARYQADGNIEYLGRLDEQVKVRGYRIELGEIEAALVGHPEIKGAVVMASENGAGEKRLVAYVVTGTEQRELREWLKQKLPDYMVPQMFVTLEALPLTANGKVDRRALPAATEQGWELSEGYVAPRTVLEELIANIWAGVLGVARVGIHDNFFELGGHSLLATQVISRVREAVQVELAVSSLFEEPTVAGQARRCEEGRRRPQQLAPPLQRQRRDSALPLSFAQQRLWFIDQLEPQSAAYNLPAAVRLSGALNLRALRQTINEIIGRHETLRTSFVSVDGEPQQVIAVYRPRALPLIDLSALAAATRESETQRLALAEARQAFDLASESLLRVQVVRLSAAEHVVLFTMHHIVSDGWSLGVLIGELTALYGAYASGAGSPLRELELQYADYAVWQREWLQGEVLAEQLGYWKEQLAELPAELELGVGRGRPAVQNYRGATVGFAVSAEVSMGLKRLSQREGATLFMTLLAAFKVLLQRYSGQAEIVVGTDIANRNRVETESLIGFFVNQLVLRTDLGGNPRFTELLGRVRATALGAYEHQDVPFEKLVEELQPVRDLRRHPLFQMKFILQNAPTAVLEMKDLSLRAVEYRNETAKFDITLALTEGAAGLSGAWTYNTELFDGATIERMVGHYQSLLSAIVEDPQQQISALPLLSESERHQLLEEWNETRAAYPRELCVHELFEAQVERTPDAIAVVFEEEEVSYAELNRRANQLAHYLRGLGVRAETLVGLSLKRSVELVVGVLGVLKAGGGYVPLEASNPLERLQHMMEDAGVSMLVTEAELEEQLPAHWGQTVCVDREREAIEEQSGENVRSEVSAANVAYVIYTSGSTGKPKGTLIHHRGLTNYLSWCMQAYHLGAGEGSPVHSSISFDLVITSLYAPLLAGEKVELLAESSDANVLRKALRRTRGFSLVKLTPAHLALLAGQLSGEELVSATQVMVIGGENLLAETIRFWRKKAPGIRFFNEYGPTETVVGSCVYEITEDEKLIGSVPIGRPIANTEIYILDAELNPTPVGVAGELCIGGDGLARGYLHRPELTAEKFIPHPFAREGGARLYRTGDRARYQADGNIEYLGRLDEQVKVRGYRIELGEIEAALVGHPEIKGAVVMASEDGAGEKRLVAYVVTGTEQRELREWLKQKLPDYMVPQMFVQLEALPLTANGKVDRRALPAVEQYESKETFVAPRGLVEETLAEIWKQVLKINQVGVYDNFFEIGGHSLLGTQLLSRVRDSFQVELPLSSLFEQPTIDGLTQMIEKRIIEEVESISEEDAERLL